MIEGMAHIQINVADLERSVAFYRDILGFPVVRTFERPGRRFVFLSVAGHGEVELIGSTASPSAVGSGNPGPFGLQHIALRVTDIEQSYHELRAKGVSFLEDRSNFRQPNGPRIAFFTDPDGVVLELVEG